VHERDREIDRSPDPDPDLGDPAGEDPDDDHCESRGAQRDEGKPGRLARRPTRVHPSQGEDGGHQEDKARMVQTESPADPERREQWDGNERECGQTVRERRRNGREERRSGDGGGGPDEEQPMGSELREQAASRRARKQHQSGLNQAQPPKVGVAGKTHDSLFTTAETSGVRLAAMGLAQEVAVVGAGTMGAGIARVFADAGASVRLCARRESSLEAARTRLGETTTHVQLTTSGDEALRGAELVIETIVEEVQAKRTLLAQAEELALPEAILTTNTSSLRLAALAGELRNPQRFAGLHWLNPPELVEVVEVVGGEHTAPETLETLSSWMEELGKAPVVVRRDTPGFVVNRLQYALLREAYALVDAGVCSFADVDRAVTYGLGARWAAIGPFETMDLAGLDVHSAVAENLWPELANTTEPSPAISEALESGHGLRADNSPQARAALRERRDRVLRALRDLR
jgi:3-hydroxybutyryl-CoA dehydrogenase